MKHLVLFLLMLVAHTLAGQNLDQDFVLLSHHKEQSNGQGLVKFKGLLKIYNRYFSEQIINDCIYEESCSTFSQGAINEYGLIKGGFLSADRLMRCNRASAMDIAPIRINNEGKIKDHWSRYHLK